MKFPASERLLKEEPARCAEEMVEVRCVGRMSKEEAEKITGVKGTSRRVL